jgi:predicted enzyme related to lactoylglutathione lyase
VTLQARVALEEADVVLHLTDARLGPTEADAVIAGELRRARGKAVLAVNKLDNPADDTVSKVTEAGGSVVIEPSDRLDVARVAVVADPAGAVFGVWQPGEHRGAQLVNEPGAWSMSQLNTPDPEGAKVFYGAVFGWETDTFDMGEGEITLWRLPGYVGGEPGQPVSREVVGVMVPLSGDRSPEDASAHWSVDFWVDDVDATALKAAELGGEVKMWPFYTSVGKTAILTDPQGAVFSVSKVGPGA